MKPNYGSGDDGGGEGFRNYSESSESDGSIPTYDTSVWGAYTWTALHIASIRSPNFGLWRELSANLANDLPCPECRAHYAAWLGKNPLRVSFLPLRRMMRRDTNVGPIIINWLITLHNDVSSSLGKPTWSTQQVYDRYGGDRAAEGLAALANVKGIIGQNSYDIIARLLS
jgi:hypothetical protein